MIDLAANGFGDLEYDAFCRRVEKSFGLRLGDYKPDQMRRRISDIATHGGSTSFGSYLGLLENDTSTLANFMDQVTINVTELLRNPTMFERLFKDIVPMIERDRSSSPFTAWSAGCSYGAEAYTLAMMLHESNPARPFKITGTDVDISILAKASSGTFSASDMAAISEARRQAYFSTFDGTSFRGSMKLRPFISFQPHDLLADPYPVGRYDLICCRNVLIYFTESAQNRVYEGFFQALKPGGVLFIGGTERVHDHAKLGYELLQPFFYRKKPVSSFLRAAA